MRVIDGQHFPLVCLFDIAHRAQQVQRIGHITNARVVVHVLEWIDLQRPAIFAADQAARLIRRIGARLSHQSFELRRSENHNCRPSTVLSRQKIVFRFQDG